MPPPDPAAHSLTRVLEALKTPALALGADGAVQATNAAWRELCCGHTPPRPDGYHGANFLEACGSFLGAATEEARSRVHQVLAGALPSARLAYLAGSGWLELTAAPLAGGGALLTHAQLPGAAETFAALLESPLDALLVVNRAGTIRQVNARLEASFGYRREELLGRDLSCLLPERFRPAHAAQRARYAAHPHARPMGTGLALFGRRKGGGEFPVEISLTPLAGGALVVAAIRDLSERAQAEAARLESEQRLALHVKHTPLAVLEWDLGARTILAWNPAAERLFGYRAAEVIGRRTDLLMEPGERLGSSAAGARSTHRNRTKDGRPLLCEWYCTRLELRGQPARGAALVMDVSARQHTVGALLGAQEEERARISRDLHDGVGQALTAIGLGLNAALRDPDAAHLVALRDLAATTLEEVRRISRDLRPALLDELGLEAAVRRFARELAERSGVATDVLVRLPGRLSRDQETVLYRVMQEALTNVAKHARAAHASVVLTASEAHLHLAVEDDGVGFVVAPPAAGHVGLLGMRERLELLGGALRLESAPGRGTLVSARLPRRDPEAGV